MLIQGKLLSYGDDLTEVYHIRKKVFQEEQGITPEEDFDDLDQESIHVIVYEDSNNKKAVATGRIYYNGVNCKIGRVAVLKEYRGKQYGDFVVRMLINKALTSGVPEVYLNAQLSTVGFYEKIGFQTVGDIYEEVGIPHIKMVLKEENLCKKCSHS
ncbi:MAG: GCN5-related N-acetyltransferase [Herbinix sp.]|jgi:predicted GNAT family N-acyltransferase|nr:GCN5-related N-acetyltransferase [Herbinix sp.]MDF2801797.1 GCN5-related N-acetyltransferase [Anaerocolumna sp.]